MGDKIVNFYDKLGINKNANLPVTWENHHIYNNSMIICLGGTGTGKSNALLNYIARSSGEFQKIIICSFSTTDEPLYNLLKEKDKAVELINNIEDVPDLRSFDNKHKDNPKLIVFDDFLNVEKKKMKPIDDYLVAGRKFGFTVWLMSQNYASVPKIIIRNIESHQETVLIVDKHNKNVKDNYNNFTLSEWTTSYETNKQLNSEKNTKLASIRPFGKWFDNMFSDKNTENLHFSSMVGIMGISRKDIIQHQKSYYEKFLKEVDDHSNPEAGHFIERSWFVIFHPYNNPKLIY